MLSGLDISIIIGYFILVTFGMMTGLHLQSHISLRIPQTHLQK